MICFSLAVVYEYIASFIISSFIIIRNIGFMHVQIVLD